MYFYETVTWTFTSCLGLPEERTLGNHELILTTLSAQLLRCVTGFAYVDARWHAKPRGEIFGL